MKRFLMLLLLATHPIFAQGPTPKDWGLKAFHIQNSKVGSINFYVTEKGIDQEKPLLLMHSGCSGLATYLVVNCGEKSTAFGTVPPDQIHSFSDKFHVAFIGRAGTPFCDTVQVDEINPHKNLEEYRPFEEYIRNCGMEWELAAAKLVIDELLETLKVQDDKVIALGYSEGGILYCKLAAENDKVTHFVSVVSTGLNQFYSSIINRRMDAAMGKITQEEAQAKVDSLFATYKQIYSDPESTEKWYYGHPYKRWGSFAGYIPLTDLVQLEIPILYVNGSIDRSTPILQADYIQLEFIRLGKENLTYEVLPGVEHSLYQVVKKDGKESAISRRNDVFNLISEWIAEK